MYYFFNITSIIILLEGRRPTLSHHRWRPRSNFFRFILLLCICLWRSRRQ